MSEVHQLPVTGTADRPAPKKIMRPCDYGLLGAINGLETQVGSVEAYNKLCDAAEKLKAKIDAGMGRRKTVCLRLIRIGFIRLITREGCDGR